MISRSTLQRSAGTAQSYRTFAFSSTYRLSLSQSVPPGPFGQVGEHVSALPLALINVRRCGITGVDCETATPRYLAAVFGLFFPF